MQAGLSGFVEQSIALVTLNRERSGGLRAIALFEALKGLLVLVAGFSLLALIHHDLQDYAGQLIAHLHLNPAKRYPAIFSQLLSKATDTRLRDLAMLASLYSVARFIEAFGLWYEKKWAEWFALASGGIYLPVELYEISKGFSWMKFTFVALNLLIVLYLVVVLRYRQTSRLL